MCTTNWYRKNKRKKANKKNYLSTNTAKLTSVDRLNKEEVSASISSENSFNPK